MTRTAFIIIAICLLAVPAFSQQIYTTDSGKVDFISNAPLEIIRASSQQLECAIDINEKTFAFRIDNRSFIGFNSPLQQEHFYENYMEVQLYPASSFKGKIIEDLNPASRELQAVRAKGMLDIHGVSRERIIKGTVRFQDDRLEISATFTVPLEEHQIKIPRVVYQKIAESIDVSVNASLLQMPVR